MNRAVAKKIIVLGVILALLVLAVSIFIQVSRPRFGAVINGQHNPLSAHVSLDGQKLYPSGKEGRTYKVRAGAGTHKIKIEGPYIQTQEKEVSASFFGEVTADFETKVKTPEEIARQSINDSSAKIDSLRVFGNAIVFRVLETAVANEDGEHTHPFLVIYDEDERLWKQLGSSDVSGVDEVILPEAGVEYFYGLDNE